jgi:uncharacterized integral membrane protein
MKRILTLSLSILLIFLITMLFIQNGETVEVKFLIWRFKSTLALFSVLAFVFGALITFIFSFPAWLKKRKNLHQLQNELNSVLKNSIQTPPTSTHIDDSNGFSKEL